MPLPSLRREGSTISTIVATTGERVRRTLLRTLDLIAPADSPAPAYIRPVLKCAFAYLIASMAVYLHPLSAALGHIDLKHLSATVAVYFHPYRTRGLMLQLLMFVTWAIGFLFTITLMCMWLLAYLFLHNHRTWLYAVDLVLSLSALGFISYCKLRVGRPTFNTACLLACICIISTVVHEGSINASVIPVDKLYETFVLVVYGCVCLVCVCFCCWPTSATHNLRAALNQSCDLMLELLAVLSHTFLNAQDPLQAADVVARIKTNTAAMTASLEEAQYECLVAGREREYLAFKRLVTSATGLYSLLGGLRGSAEMNWDLMQHYAAEVDRGTVETVIPGSAVDTTLDDGDTPRAIFAMFVYHLTPLVRLFIFTLQGILRQIPFEHGPELSVPETERYHTLLAAATALFTEKHTAALDTLYGQTVFTAVESTSESVGQEEAAAACGNFATVLQEFAAELGRFLHALEEYGRIRQFPPPRLYSWCSFGRLAKWIRSHASLPMRPLVTAPATPSFRHEIWRRLRALQQPDIQLGIRVAIGAACILVFAYLDATQPYFIAWRGEWALVVYAIMMNRTTGSTSNTVPWRIMGTMLGAVVAWAVWRVFDAEAYALATAGFLVSMGLFYIIIFWKRDNAYGRFILLTYNLTAMYSYLMVQHDDEDEDEGGANPIVYEIAFHRMTAVTVGIIWALVMANFFLPTSARRRLKHGLLVVWLKMGLTVKRDILSYLTLLGKEVLDGIQHLPATRAMVNELNSLVGQAALEFRLRGPFPQPVYALLVQLTQRIVDWLQNLTTLIELDLLLLPNEAYVIRYTAEERDEVSHRLFLTLYMLALAMQLGVRIPGKPALIDHAMDRMLVKLHAVRRDRMLLLKNEDYVLLYLYVLVTEGIMGELDRMIDTVGYLFGEVSPEELVM